MLRTKSSSVVRHVLYGSSAKRNLRDQAEKWQWLFDKVEEYMKDE